MPLGELDYARLANLAVPGGTIRSIALNAAFLAAEAGAPVDMAHLRRAAHLEAAKHATTLGAVALEGRIIEKHFTDSNDREGPDHKLAMNPQSWRDMVDRTRELERALGQGVKRIEKNEMDTVVVQRRRIRTDREVPAGTVLSEEDLICLRPCPEDPIPPYEITRVLVRALTRDLSKGEYLRWSDLQS